MVQKNFGISVETSQMEYDDGQNFVNCTSTKLNEKF